MDRRTESLAAGGAQMVLARGCFYALGYVATVMLARGLGPIEYGVYGVVISVLVWVEQSAQFTVAPAVAKLVPEGDPDGAVAGTALVLNTALFTVLLVAMWSSAPVLGRTLNVRDGATLLGLAALDLPFFGAYVVSQAISQGRREFRRTAVAQVVYSGTKAVGIGVLVAVHASVVGALVVNVLASAAGLVCLAPRTARTVGRWRRVAAGRLLRLAPWFALYMVGLQLLAHLDVWMLTSLRGDDPGVAVGTYVAARTVAIVPSVVLLGITDVLLPSISGALAAGDRVLAGRQVQAAMRFLTILIPPGVVLAFLTGEELMTLLLSRVYAPGAASLGVLTASGGFFALAALFGAALNAAGRTPIAAGALFLVAPFAVGVNVVLVPALGAIGAASAQLLTALLATILLGILVHRRFGAFVSAGTVLRAGVATVALAVVAWPFTVGGPLLLLYYAACLALYVAVLVALGELRLDEIRALRRGMPAPVGAVD
jgi:O-antigen/teichoic acid export membrane protein